MSREAKEQLLDQMGAIRESYILEYIDARSKAHRKSLKMRFMIPLAAAMAPLLGCPLIVKPNAGLPRLEGGQTVYDVGPEDFAAAMAPILEAGAAIVGGCCGTTPAHLAALAALVAAGPRPA